MKQTNEPIIQSTVARVLVLYVFTFIVVWNSTANYRENVSRPLTASLAIVKSSLN
ncbi:MAG: hypothetical protein QGG19_03985 [Alphaproteobacteria bacterium]|jgi:hypothetical protein|nr:hypothetical protein [Alphaproteobacteria bacterium]MDP6255576.1 hypothetical protein [Alphaproteobacteria bacterium]MDP7052721.1 hypothetical protein [Alphaproteobacteria bacterium]MDP7229839.1 hypothetical protein [Alphaproteobacteria bacterium]MDP7460979.1 hypothetical protein [Alphaproteobacteria bacterium]